jgi:hypothetical protein
MDNVTLQGRNYPLLNQPEELSVSQIVTRVGTFSRNIEDSKKKLESDLQKLNDTSSIVIRRNWVGFIKKSSVEEGFKITYKDLSEGFKVCGEALIDVNDHISEILKFIVMIVRLESDIYGKLDDLATNDVDIRYFFEDLIQKSDIKDEKIKEILEGLWNRTYTLRDRLRMLQDKINARVDDIVEKIQARIDSLENEQKRFFIEGKKELLKEVEQLKAGLVQQFEEKSKEISRCLQENQRKGEELREEMRRNINHAKDELSSSTQKCEQILAQVIAKEQQIVSDYEKGYKELQNSIDTYEEQLETAIASAIERFSEIANQNEKELADKVSVATEDLRQQLDAQQAKFHEIIELHRKTARRTIIYATSLATVLGTCVSITLHFFL